MEEIEKQVNKAYAELKKLADDYNANEKKETLERNEAPCSVCGKKEFIVKYRDVNGKVEGRISGSFSLFGGSISGYIDGETHTDPVLCCRNCQNERKILLPDKKSVEDYWDMQVPYMSTYYALKPNVGKVSKWLQDYGLEVACLLCKKIYPKDYRSFYEYTSLDKYPRFTETEFGYLGLKRKYHIDGFLPPLRNLIWQRHPVATIVVIELLGVAALFYFLSKLIVY